MATRARVALQPPPPPVVWTRGKPPSIGWWPTCEHNKRAVYPQPSTVPEWDRVALRWWNGKRWSAPAFKGYERTPGFVHTRATTISGISAFIMWAPRPAHWPQRSLT